MKNPETRFKDDNVDWEIKKLKNIYVSSCSGGTPQSTKPEYYNGSIPFLTISDINDAKFINHTKKTITEMGLEHSTAKIVPSGSLALAMYASVGKIGIANIDMATSQAFHNMIFENNVTCEFIYQRLKKKEIDNEWEDIISTGTQRNLNSEKIANTTIFIPPLKIQKEIASFLSDIDQKISNQELLIQKLKNAKSSLLTKMFPQDGQRVPEIRFAGFTNDWEQRKLGDVFTESREIGHSGDIAKKLTVKLWGKGVYAKNNEGSIATQYYIRHTGQFVYSKLDFLNSAFGVIPKELDSFESTADLPAFDCHGINPYFMYYRAVQPSFYITNGMIADGSRKAKRIHTETFLNMPLMLPSKEEQDKIVDFFQRLDNLITLHQRKLDKYKEVKAALLEKLLV